MEEREAADDTPSKEFDRVCAYLKYRIKASPTGPCAINTRPRQSFLPCFAFSLRAMNAAKLYLVNNVEGLRVGKTGREDGVSCRTKVG